LADLILIDKRAILGNGLVLGADKVHG